MEWGYPDDNNNLYVVAGSDGLSPISDLIGDFVFSVPQKLQQELDPAMPSFLCCNIFKICLSPGIHTLKQ
jgi:hypothetical protein